MTCPTTLTTAHESHILYILAVGIKLHDFPVQIRTVSYGDLSINIKEGALSDGLGARIWVAAHILCRSALIPDCDSGKSEQSQVLLLSQITALRSYVSSVFWPIVCDQNSMFVVESLGPSMQSILCSNGCKETGLRPQKTGGTS